MDADSVALPTQVRMKCDERVFAAAARNTGSCNSLVAWTKDRPTVWTVDQTALT